MASLLCDFVGNCREVISANQVGELPLGYRRHIWHLLGPIANPKKRLRSQEHMMRFMIAKTVVEQSLAAWHSVFEDQQPEHLISVAIDVFEGRVLPPQARAMIKATAAHLDDLCLEFEDEQNNIMPGYAGNQLILVAMQDELFDDADAEVQPTTDMDITPAEFDPALICSMAHSEGPPWNPDSSKPKRQKFWNAWLDLVVSTYAKG